MDKTTETVEIYNKIAKKYSEMFDTDLSDDKFLDKFLSFLPTKSKILDVGCGTGRNSRYYSNNGFDTIGTDLSDEMLKIAKKNNPKIKFVKQDMRHLIFKEKFAGISFAYSLFHVNKKEAKMVIEDAKKLLTPDGVLFFILQEGKGELLINEPFLPKEKIFLNLYTKEEISKILVQRGFEILHTDLKVKKQRPGELDFSKLVIIAKLNNGLK